MVASVATAAPAASSAKVALTAKNVCIIDEKHVFLHAIIAEDFKANADGRTMGQTDHTSRTLWQVNCNRLTGQWACSGVSIHVDDVEAHGGQLDAFDVNPNSAIQVASATRTTASLHISDHTTFGIDTVKGKVTYSESGASGEGRGEASCGSPI